MKTNRFRIAILINAILLLQIFTITGCDDESPTSSEGVEYPESPTNLSAACSTFTIVNLSWQHNSDDEINFILQRKLDDDSWDTIFRLPYDVTSYRDLPPYPEARYYYRIAAENDNGQSPWSNVEGIVTHEPHPDAPASPILLTVTCDYRLVDLTWQDNSYTEDWFRIQRKTYGEKWKDLVDLLVDTSCYQDDTADYMTKYYYRVLALNDSGASYWSNVGEILTGEPHPDSPAPPSNLVATCGDSSNNVTLTWVDNSNDERGFNLQRRGKSDDWMIMTVLSANKNSYGDNTGKFRTKYFYRIASENNFGRSVWSDIAEVTTGILVCTGCVITYEDNYQENLIAAKSKANPRLWWSSDLYGNLRIMDVHNCSSEFSIDEAGYEEFDLNGGDAGCISIRFNRRINERITILNYDIRFNPPGNEKQVSIYDLNFCLNDPSLYSWEDKYLNGTVSGTTIHTAKLPFMDRLPVKCKTWYKVKVVIDRQKKKYSLRVNGINLGKGIPIEEIIKIPIRQEL